jgi:hypothetical protein
MQTFAVLVLATASVASAATFAENAETHFAEFKAKFGKRYENVAEDSKRFSIFRESMRRVDEKNVLNGSPSFGVTKVFLNSYFTSASTNKWSIEQKMDKIKQKSRWSRRMDKAENGMKRRVE